MTLDVLGNDGKYYVTTGTASWACSTFFLVGVIIGFWVASGVP